MQYRLLITPDAVADIENARSWFDDQREDLGVEFLIAIRKAISSIQKMPGRYKFVKGGCQRALVRRFRYVVIFKRDGNSLVVIAVYHSSRDEDFWKTRIPAED